jgi:hypothetical protein
MTEANTPKFGTNGGRLAADVRTREKVLLQVEVIQSLNGTSNAGDVCKYCILDALRRLDDRPRNASAR